MISHANAGCCTLQTYTVTLRSFERTLNAIEAGEDAAGP